MLLPLLAAVLIARASPTPSPSPSPTRLLTITTVTSHSRSENLVGTAFSASTGTINQEQIEMRPILRPGEVLEAIPGLVISQHSGGGKANQYYLRGFQLDHGTDLESTILGTPINLPTHAHGQGYSDVNWLIPELVSFVEFKKGPYFADQGDFSTAGSYNLYYRNTIAPTALYTIGGYGYNRLFFADSPQFGAGHLLCAFEYVHDSSTMEYPDNYRKYNGVLRYSTTTKTTDFNVTGIAYSGAFNSSDQIPLRLVDAGIISRFGLIDPTDGGITWRTALSAQLNHTYGNGALHSTVYGFEQYLDLFSNFTYYLDNATDYYNVTGNPYTCNAVYTTCTPGAMHAPNYTSDCPADNSAPRGDETPHSVTPAPFTFSCGDQREQQDKRFVSGFALSRDFAGNRYTTTAGIGFNVNNIAPVALYLTNARGRYANGTLSEAHVVEQDADAYVQTVYHTGKLRVVPGLRADIYNSYVADIEAANSGFVHAGMVNPKLTTAYELSPNRELYLNFGESFHSNDMRGAVQTVDPQTHEPFDSSGAPVRSVTPLVRAWGEELGYRYSTSRVTSTIALWQLNIASELIFDGDHGTTFAGQPTLRKGIEFANFYTPTNHWTFDADIATSSARFLTDPDNVGTYVPESVGTVIASGATIDEPYYAATLRMRYFGPRELIENGSAVSPPSLLFNGQVIMKVAPRYHVTFDLLNIFNAQAADVTYYYGSWLPEDAANLASTSNPSINPLLGGSGVNDYHFHPSEARTFRLTFTATR